MTYTIDPGGDVSCEVRAIGRDQVAKAIADLEHPDDLVEAVHDCRKRCKKIRGLARLVRPALGDGYEPTNAVFRDAAHRLGPLRDAHALRETFVKVVDEQRGLFDTVAVEPVVDELEHRADEVAAEPATARRAMAGALELISHGRDLIDGWELDEDGWDAIGPGLAKTYRRGRKALHAVRECPTAENLHEYRKRTKYTWYHLRLLDELAPPVTEPLEAALHDLSNLLGDDHDLAVLVGQLDADPDGFGGADPVQAARMLIAAHCETLQREALRLGGQLHAETTTAFADRFAAYHEAWRHDRRSATA